MVRDPEFAPPALIANARHNHVLHENVLVVTVKTEDVPRIPEGGRLHVREMEHGVYAVTLHYGFMQQPNVPRALHGLKGHGLDVSLKDVPYFLSRERVVATPGNGMWLWREKLYAFMQKNAADASVFFCLPNDHVVEIGTPVTI